MPTQPARHRSPRSRAPRHARYRLTRRWRRRLRLARTVAVLVLIVLVVAVTHHSGGGGRRLAADSSHQATQSAAHPAEPVAAAAANAQTALNHLVSTSHQHLGVAGVDLATGKTIGVGADTPMYTASVVKVDIAVTLLRDLAQQHRGLGSTQATQLREMIENSDDDAATDLWHAVGGKPAVDRTNTALGLRHTQAGSDDYWGLTRTTAADQLLLLRKVLTGNALSAKDRALLVKEMHDVETDQRWGISAAAPSDDSDAVALKNGWLPHAADGDRWIINSEGMIGSASSGVLLVVLSDHRPTEAAGIRAVEQAAALAGDVLRA